ncbi:MAG: glycosyltransferase [Clostridium sp.]|nr:glycosyltransferase [Clostridium sp.]
MKVLILNPILYTSETDSIPKVASIKDTMIYALCMGFVKNGDEVTLAAAEPYRPVCEEEYPFPILWFPCKCAAIWKPRCLPLLGGLGGYLKKHKQEYDYIISSEVFSMLTLSAAVHAGEKLIIWHELGAHNNLLKKLPSKFWYHVVARLFMRNIPVIPRSEQAARFIGQFCNRVLPVRIDHGVDLDKIACSREKEKHFVVLSQLIERKHIDGIIDCFAAFLQETGKGGWRLQIIGDGILREKLEGQVKDLGLEDSVLFLGKLNHEKLMPILAKAYALLVNTSKDNSMVSIVESIAAGTPVLTTEVPFNASYIKKEKLGIVKNGWSVKELEEICQNNGKYVINCINYREKLSNQYLAEQFNRVGGQLGK